MRIVSWNCNMGFAKKREAVMALQPDILVLQECSAQDIATTDAPFKHWVGSNKHKGIAVIGFADHTYSIDHSYTQEWPWFLPVRVEDIPLRILGLWACMKDQRLRYVRVMHHAVDHYAQFLSLPQMIVIGDFNSNAIWDKRYSAYSHSELVKKLGTFELMSMYHHQRAEMHGEETIATQYMYRNLAKPYHLDYAFVSKEISMSCELHIGAPEKWLQQSDHMPLILTLSL